MVHNTTDYHYKPDIHLKIFIIDIIWKLRCKRINCIMEKNKFIPHHWCFYLSIFFLLCPWIQLQHACPALNSEVHLLHPSRKLLAQAVAWLPARVQNTEYRACSCRTSLAVHLSGSLLEATAAIPTSTPIVKGMGSSNLAWLRGLLYLQSICPVVLRLQKSRRCPSHLWSRVQQSEIGRALRGEMWHILNLLANITLDAFDCSVAVIVRGMSECHTSLSDSTSDFASLDSWQWITQSWGTASSCMQWTTALFS